MLEVPGAVASFEVWQEEADDQDSVWLCHNRGKGFLSMSPSFPKALLQSRRSRVVSGSTGGPPGFWSYLASCYPYPLGFLLLSSGGHTSMAESPSLLAPAAVNLSFTGKEKTTSGSLAGA